MSDSKQQDARLTPPASAADLLAKGGERQALSVYLTGDQRLVLEGLARMRAAEAGGRPSLSVAAVELMFSDLEDDRLKMAWTEGAMADALSRGDLETAVFLKVSKGFLNS